MKNLLIVASLCLSSFIIGNIFQIEMAKKRMHKVAMTQEWGDSDYVTVWYIITGSGE
jgi:hypothetical protein